MKKIGWLVTAVAVLAFAACGGSDTATPGGGGGTTPSATSTKSIAADQKVMQVGFTAYQQVMTAIGGGAMVVKETGSDSISFNCTEASYASFACTATDSSEPNGICTVTGSATADYSSFTFDLVCNNFHPDLDTTIDGSFAITVTVGNTGAAMTTKNMTFGKTGDTEKETSGTCDISDDDTSYDGGACTEGGECSAASTDLIATIAFTVGSEGLTLVDECGTYVYGAGFNATTNLCGDPSSFDAGSPVFVMGFDLQGTFNGESADFAETWTCNYSS
jgi:hypothetical protein